MTDDLRYAPSAPATAEVVPMVETVGLTRDYAMPGGAIHAVRDVTLRIDAGQLVALRGRSGSGKTTFLSMVGALDRPTSGTVAIDGDLVSERSESELINFRRRKI